MLLFLRATATAFMPIDSAKNPIRRKLPRFFFVTKASQTRVRLVLWIYDLARAYYKVYNRQSRKTYFLDVYDSFKITCILPVLFFWLKLPDIIFWRGRVWKNYQKRLCFMFLWELAEKNKIAYTKPVYTDFSAWQLCAGVKFVIERAFSLCKDG